MAYEDPNTPSPAPGDIARESNASADQSKTFLGGKHHPWRRLFALTVDICTAGFALFLLLIFAFSAAMPEQTAGFAKAMENPIVASVVLYLIWLPAEAVLLSLLGTTPAKWLFGIKVAHPGGGLLSFSESLNRSFLVFVQGVGFGIPFVALHYSRSCSRIGGLRKRVQRCGTHRQARWCFTKSGECSVRLYVPPLFSRYLF